MSGVNITIVMGGMPVDKMVADGTAGETCPVATQDILVNVENRNRAVEEHDYGPMNPELDETGENDEFWAEIADDFGVDIETAQQSRCGNCAAFNQTKKILTCIAKGIGEDGSSPWDTIDAGDLGYCQFLKFKCAARRTCDAWVVGGPITDQRMSEDHDIL